MFRPNPLLIAGALAATSLSVLAVPANAAITEKVGFGDLDLNTAEGNATLGKRIDSAAGRVCFATGERQQTLLAACRSVASSDAQDAVRRAREGGSPVILLR